MRFFSIFLLLSYAVVPSSGLADLSTSCIEASSGNSRLFGASLALGQSWIAVGDPQAGIVTLFAKNPPHHEMGILRSPLADEAGFGFALAAYEDILIIGAYSRDGGKERGAVYRYDMRSLNILDQSDEARLVGFSVAAGDGVIAYGTRTLTDPFEASGTIVELRDHAKHIHVPDGPSDYFGRALDISGGKLVAAAPAIGRLGSLWLIDFVDSIDGLLTVPEILSEHIEQRGAHVSVSDRACVLSGRTELLASGSIVWIDCAPNGMRVLDAQGQTAAAGNLVAFADARDGGSARLYDLGNASKDPTYVDLTGVRIADAGARSVAMDSNILVIGAYAGSLKPSVQVMGLDELDFSTATDIRSCE